MTPVVHALDIFTLPGFLSPAECEAEISRSEAVGFTEAPVTTASGPVMMKDARNNERVMIDDAERAEQLWQRLWPHVPSPFHNQWTPVGLNERLRYYRYDPGQRFNWHRDGAFYRSERERSLLTFLVYLNEGCEGGGTTFDLARSKQPGDSIVIRPEAGTALLFHHPYMHRGDEVTAGRKYVLRSDVMFRHN